MLLLLNSSAEGHLRIVWTHSSLCSLLTARKRRKASEPWQSATSAVSTSMEHQCEILFVQLPDEEKERVAHEEAQTLDSVGLESARVALDAGARWQAHDAQFLKEHEFDSGLCSPSLFVHAKRDVRLLVGGDDFMAEMPTHEERWFESVLFF